MHTKYNIYGKGYFKEDEVIECYKYTSKGWKLIRTLVPSRVRRRIKRFGYFTKEIM